MSAKQTAALRAAMASLTTMPIERLRAQYEQAFEKPAGKSRRDHLVRALAERATGSASGGPGGSEKPAAPTAAKPHRPGGAKRDPRLPEPGGRITRRFKGREYVLEILDDGFRVGKQRYTSPTAAALAISGYAAVSGPAWWGYAQPKPAAPKPPPKGRSKGD